jgi:predicted DNA-binding transcriptional regulator YafY
VEIVDEQTTILSVKMQNKNSVLKFALGFGSDCEVLEPTWLQEAVREECEKILKGK